MRFLLAVVVALTTVSALAQTEVSSPRLVPRPAQIEFTIASSPDGFLTVWRDASALVLRAARIGNDGTLLDPVSFPVAGYPVYEPVAAWTGSHFAVVHQDSATRLSVTSISSDAGVGTPRPLESAAEKLQIAGTLAQIAHSGAGTLLAARSMGSLSLVALDQDDRVTAAHSFFVAMYDGPLVVPFGDLFLVVWRQQSAEAGLPAIYGALVNGRAEVIGAPRSISPHGSSVSVAASGERALVTYTRFEPDYYANPYGLARGLFGRIVTPAAVSDELRLATTQEDAIGASATAAGDGRFAVVWAQKTGEVPGGGFERPSWAPLYSLYEIDVSSDGVPASEPALLRRDASEPHLSTNGTTTLLAWRNDDGRIESALLDDAISPLRRVDSPRSAAIQEGPVAATTGGVTLVAWLEDADGDGRAAIYARRTGAVGQWLDAAPVRLSGTDASPSIPAVAAANGEFAVAWAAPSTLGGSVLHVRRIRADGTLLDEEPIDAGPGGGMVPSIASDGTSYALLTYDNIRLGSSIILPDGKVVRHDLALFSAGGWRKPAIAWAGDRYVAAVPIPTNVFVATGPVTRDHVNTMAFGSDGQRIGVVREVAGGNEDSVNPSIACHDRSCLVLWRMWHGVDAALIDPLGAVRPLLAVTTAYSGWNDVIATAAGYKVGWQSYDGSTAGIWTANYTGGGSVASPPVRLIRDGDAATSSDLSPDGRGDALLAYTMAVEGIRYGGAARAFIRPAEPPIRRAARH